jgi:hypothetical protein
MSIDLERRLLKIEKAGFWDGETLEGYRRDLQRSLQRLDGLGHPSRCLIDQRELQVQSATYVERMSDLFLEAGVRFPDRTACVTGSVLANMQDQRLTSVDLEGIAYAYFRSIEEAEVWLFSAGDEAPAE